VAPATSAASSSVVLLANSEIGRLIYERGIAMKVINHLGTEVMKVFSVG
jgi:hypothetical protein